MLFGNNIEKQANQLLDYFKKFDVTDLIGFGEILGVEEKDNFVDYVTDIVSAFWQENRIKRRQLLKLAKDIAIANQYMVPDKDKELEIEPGDTIAE